MYHYTDDREQQKLAELYTDAAFDHCIEYYSVYTQAFWNFQ